MRPAGQEVLTGCEHQAESVRRLGIGIHSLRKTAINDAILNGAQMQGLREFAGHSDIRATELYFVRKQEDGERAARKIRIRVPLAEKEVFHAH